MAAWMMLVLPGLLGCRDKAQTTPDTATGDTAEENPYCAALGFAGKDFDTAAAEITYNEPMPDFTLATMDGSFQLSAVWTGCDVVVLLPIDQDFLSEDRSELLTGADENTVFVFFSVADDDADAAAAVADFRDDLEADLDDATLTAWSERLYYVTVGQSDAVLQSVIDGLQGSAVAGIDQYQNLRRGGSLSVALTSGWFPAVSHARYTGRGFNYEAQLGERLAEEEATLGDELLVVTLLDGLWAEGTATEGEAEGVVRVTLPDATEMARYDRAEVVFRELCDTGEFPHEGASCTGEVGLHAYICASDDCEDDENVFKFYKGISGYYTGGWWTLDASQILPLLRDGGEQVFQIPEANIDEAYQWRAEITLRLYDEVDEGEAHATAAAWMEGWRGMGLQSVYDETTMTYRITAPQGTTRVEFRDLVTTHGGGGSGGCGEFCTTEQTLLVNGEPYEHVWEQKETWDCADRVSEGVTPNQWGTWYFDRASWCPGGTGELWVSDITDAFDLSGANELTLTATQSGEFPYTGNLEASPWLVFYGGEGEPVIEEVAPEGCTNLHVRLRDFSDEFEDFVPMVAAFGELDSDDEEREDASNVVYDAVEEKLVEIDGSRVPALAWPEDTLPFSTAESFSMWFRDVDGVNIATDLDDQVRRTTAGTAMIIGHGISEETLSPVIDEDFGYGVGKQDRLGSKTIEVWTTATYAPGQQLRFASSDDLWVFLDGQLVIDSGGFGGHLSSYNGYQRTHVLDLDDHGLTEGQEVEIRAYIADRSHDGDFKFWAEAPTCE